MKEKNNFIVTFYDGKKADQRFPATINTSTFRKILGMSVEGRFALNSNNYIVAEVAKSSYSPASGISQPSNLLQKTFDFNIHSNEAYSLKLYNFLPSTDTHITAFYKKLGENFESFNLYPVNVNQASWSAKVDQNLWRRKVTVTAAVRKNDFLSTLAIPSSLSTRTVFKSLQASFKFPKYPFVSIGYYPSSQLSVSNSNMLVENQYNTLNMIVSHSYKAGNLSMNTNAVYTRFYNNSTDSGFIYYNAKSISVNHSIFLSRFTLESSLSEIKQDSLNLAGFRQAVTYQINNFFSMKAGLKCNRLNNVKNLFGADASVSLHIKHFGTIQAAYEKSYLPDFHQQLREIDIGSIGYYRNF
jgi:hypothetical protein